MFPLFKSDLGWAEFTQSVPVLAGESSLRSEDIELSCNCGLWYYANLTAKMRTHLQHKQNVGLTTTTQLCSLDPSQKCTQKYVEKSKYFKSVNYCLIVIVWKVHSIIESSFEDKK